jgi:hypothetical protein
MSRHLAVMRAIVQECDRLALQGKTDHDNHLSDQRLHGKLQPTPRGSTYVDPEQLQWQPSQFDYRNEGHISE